MWLLQLSSTSAQASSSTGDQPASCGVNYWIPEGKLIMSTLEEQMQLLSDRVHELERERSRVRT